MKILIIGGNRFVGLRLSLLLAKLPGCELHILNRTGQAPHAKDAVKHKGDRKNLGSTGLDHDWDVIFDFACFTGDDADGAVQFFGKVKRYIFISTISVYDAAADLTEGDFDPLAPLPDNQAKDYTPEDSYQDGKRRAEAVFAKQNKFPVVSVRLPYILGDDDYTQRLEFHVRCLEQGEPMFVPNPKARVSMIHAQDAARFLFWCLDRDFTGPINVASPEPIAMEELIAQIEKVTGETWMECDESSPENDSPYGSATDFFVDVSKVKKLGFEARKIREWLPALVESLSSQKTASPSH